MKRFHKKVIISLRDNARPIHVSEWEVYHECNFCKTGVIDPKYVHGVIYFKDAYSRREILSKYRCPVCGLADHGKDRERGMETVRANTSLKRKRFITFDIKKKWCGLIKEYHGIWEIEDLEK